MPTTAKQYGLDNPNDFYASADAAGRMYRDLLKQTQNDLPKSLAAYNWGIGNVNRKELQAALLETKHYINKKF